MTIKGVTYEVVEVKSLSHIKEGRSEITLKKPRGKRLYHVVQYEDGSLSSIV